MKTQQYQLLLNLILQVQNILRADSLIYRLREQDTNAEQVDSKEGQGVFYLRNVKLIVPDDQTAIDQLKTQTNVSKVIRNGQVLFIRDGKTFNALGAIVAE